MSDADIGAPLPQAQDTLTRKILMNAPFLHALGMSMAHIAYGVGILELPWREDLVNDPAVGILAGGTITTLLDHATGIAVFTRFETPRPFATLDLRIDYLKPATRGLPVHGRGECYRMTRRIAFARGSAYHPAEPDRPIATAVGTFMLDSTPIERLGGQNV
jgi:uncharacterized protein (TIGR00369 family)